MQCRPGNKPPRPPAHPLRPGWCRGRRVFVAITTVMAVLLLEVWLDYRKEIFHRAQTTSGLLRHVYRLLTLGSDDVSAAADEMVELQE